MQSTHMTFFKFSSIIHSFFYIFCNCKHFFISRQLISHPEDYSNNFLQYKIIVLYQDMLILTQLNLFEPPNIFYKTFFDRNDSMLTFLILHYHFNHS